MIKSMTGYGKAEFSGAEFRVKAELRSLNSKFFDLNLRCPSNFRDKEMMLRNHLSEQIVRGKADAQIVFENTGGVQSFSINRELVNKYMQDIAAVLPNTVINTETLLELAMKMPDVQISVKEETNENEWETMMKVVTQALVEFNHFRENEGKVMEKEFESRIKNILQLLADTEKFETERMETVKTRLRNNLNDAGMNNMDENRFEQEMIYFLERMDFSEEKTRLRSHCDFFIKTMREADSNGRKLNFIGQEMGREINTLGSKANHSELQKVVVMMKDELEKIKEQLLNVL